MNARMPAHSFCFLKNQEDNKKQNECAGILAFISKKKEEAKEDGQISENKPSSGISKCLQFQLKNAHYL
jgi:hypothetical protein